MHCEPVYSLLLWKTCFCSIKWCSDQKVDSVGNNYAVPPDVLACYKKYDGNYTAQLEFCENPNNRINSVLAFDVDTGEVTSCRSHL